MVHIPVLLKETIEGLNLKPGMVVLDATLGGGGHSKEICNEIGGNGTLVGIDQDRAAISRVKNILRPCHTHLVVSNFREIQTVLRDADILKIDAAMFDLGFSSFQIEESKRGFSFLRDEPLLMTFDESPGEEKLTAKEIVNTWGEDSLADVIYGYGGERYAKRIARVMVEERTKKPLETTKDLVRIVEMAVPNIYKRRKIHFATKTFQALRIAVNDEIGSLRRGLEDAWSKLSIEGHVAVISFHELEDRAVKNFFKSKRDSGEAKIVTKKPMIPSREELMNNPRSRSAKLRIAKKINETL